MDALSIEALKRLLREIRDAAREMDLRGWSASKNLLVAIEKGLPVLAQNHPELQAAPNQLTRDIQQGCMAWRSNYELVIASPSPNSSNYEAALEAAKILERRIEAMLRFLDSQPAAGNRRT